MCHGAHLCLCPSLCTPQVSTQACDQGGCSERRRLPDTGVESTPRALLRSSRSFPHLHPHENTVSRCCCYPTLQLRKQAQKKTKKETQGNAPVKSEPRADGGLILKLCPCGHRCCPRAEVTAFSWVLTGTHAGHQNTHDQAAPVHSVLLSPWVSVCAGGILVSMCPCVAMHPAGPGHVHTPVRSHIRL